MMSFAKQSIVGEKTGRSMLSLDLDNSDNRLKHDREIDSGEPTSKTLKRLRQEQQKMAIMDMFSFYQTATKVSDWASTLAKDLLHDLIVHPLMLREDQPC